MSKSSNTDGKNDRELPVVKRWYSDAVRMDLRGQPEPFAVGADGNSNRYDESICRYVTIPHRWHSEDSFCSFGDRSFFCAGDGPESGSARNLV